MDACKELDVAIDCLPVEVIAHEDAARQEQWPIEPELEKRFAQLVRRVEVDEIGGEAERAENLRADEGSPSSAARALSVARGLC